MTDKTKLQELRSMSLDKLLVEAEGNTLMTNLLVRMKEVDEREGTFDAMDGQDLWDAVIDEITAQMASDITTVELRPDEAAFVINTEGKHYMLITVPEDEKTQVPANVMFVVGLVIRSEKDPDFVKSVIEYAENLSEDMKEDASDD